MYEALSKKHANQPRAFKFWALAFFVIIYFVVQHMRSTLTGISTQKNITGLKNEPGLGRFVANDVLAKGMRSVLGDGTAKQLVSKIRQRLNHICHAPYSDDAYQIPIYIVTPTCRRHEQIAELTRLAQILMQVPNMYWLLCESASEKSALVLMQLKKWPIRVVHLLGGSNSQGNDMRTGAVHCRNVAMKWIRENASRGVVHFADEAYSYDVNLFEEMRSTEKVSMWPVGLVSSLSLSTPIVKNGKFCGFYSGYVGGGRKFPVDKAGFAVNVEFLKTRPNAQMSCEDGREEDSFLRSLAPFEPDQIELKANNCTKLLVWHVQPKRCPHPSRRKMKERLNTNLVELEKLLLR